MKRGAIVMSIFASRMKTSAVQKAPHNGALPPKRWGVIAMEIGCGRMESVTSLIVPKIRGCKTSTPVATMSQH